MSFNLPVENSSKSRSSNSDVLDSMKSRYPCIYQPMNPSNATLEEEDDGDEDRRYLTSLWVFGIRDIYEPESPLPPSKWFHFLHLTPLITLERYPRNGAAGTATIFYVIRLHI